MYDRIAVVKASTRRKMRVGDTVSVVKDSTTEMRKDAMHGNAWAV
jgi:hypothetical protein